MVDRILVTFATEDGGTDELSWGQQSIWMSMTNAGSSLPIGDFASLPVPITLADATAVLRFVLHRHQSLRTRVVTGEDGVPRQVVQTSGVAPLEVVHAGADDPTEVARRTMARYYAVPFDYVDEWPIRMAAVLVDGLVTHIVAVYCHIAVDVHGIDALVADLATMDPATGEPTVAVAGLTPLQQARRQIEPAARRHSDAAVRYCAGLIRDIPAQRYRESPDPRTPRWWEIRLNSTAAYLAGRAIAARNRVHTSPVLLAAFVVAISEVTRIHPAVAELVVNNRFRPGMAGAIGPISQECLGVIDVADSTFDEVVGRAWQASTRAGKHAYYDPDDMAAMIAAAGRDRGEPIDVDCYFNDRRRAHLNPPVPDREPTGAEIAAALRATTLSWDEPLVRYDHTLFFHVDDVPGTFEFQMTADTHKLAPAEMETLMLRIEDVLVTAVLDPSTRTPSLSPKAASVEY